MQTTRPAASPSLQVSRQVERVGPLLTHADNETPCHPERE
jgi:hypothetical protein